MKKKYESVFSIDLGKFIVCFVAGYVVYCAFMYTVLPRGLSHEMAFVGLFMAAVTGFIGQMFWRMDEELRDEWNERQ